MMMLHAKYKDSVKIVEREQGSDGGFGGLNLKVGEGASKDEV